MCYALGMTNRNTTTTRTYTTLAALVDQEIVGALDGVEEGFDLDAFTQALLDQELIYRTPEGFALVTDEDGETPGFWLLVQNFDSDGE